MRISRLSTGRTKLRKSAVLPAFSWETGESEWTEERCVEQMKKLYIITGACGHLGNTIVRTLVKREQTEIRGLIMPREEAEAIPYPQVRYFTGDVRDKASLRPLFEDTGDAEVYVIHTAGIVDISDTVSTLLYDVNVNGTGNIVELCMEYSVRRLLHVSSVHAIPEGDADMVLSEINQFSPENVEGGYAKTKAQATQVVLDAVARGLDAVVVHPSGILGPYDRSGNHLVQLVSDYIRGKLPACVRGGYDFVDVRDVADGCLRALDRGRRGECYILSNRHYAIKDVLKMVRRVSGGRRLPVLPIWMARATLPFIHLHAKRKRERPLYTKYSLYTLNSNDKFSHNKATKELGYTPRDLYYTIRDTVSWLGAEARKKPRRRKMKRCPG